VSAQAGSSTASSSESTTAKRTSFRESFAGIKRMFRRETRPVSAVASGEGAVVFIERAELSDSQLVLLVRSDSRGLPSGIVAVRDVDGVDDRHLFEISTGPNGTLRGTLEYSVLGHRRWMVRANFIGADDSFEVSLPFQAGAIRRSEGTHRMRSFDGSTLQIVKN